MSRRPALPVLTSLRFFAAAAVVAFHGVITLAGANSVPPDVLEGLTVAGHGAVTFFFILSGFVLAYAHAGRDESDALNVTPTVFWRRRLARVLPAYLVGLILATPQAIDFIEHAEPWEKVVGPLSVLLFVQTWWPPFAAIWNFPAWSLSVEAVFYALFPWLSRVTGRIPRSWMALIAYVLIVMSYDWRIAPPPDTSLGRYLLALPVLYLPLFLFGMVMGRQLLFGRPLSEAAHAAIFLLGLAALVTIFHFNLTGDGILTAAFSLIIFGGARSSWITKPLASPILVLLGDASYAIYILHFPLRAWWEKMAFGMPSWLNLPLYFCLTVAVSILVFRCVETPVRNWIANPRVFRRVRVSVAE